MSILKTFYGLPLLIMIFLVFSFLDTFIYPAGRDGFDYMTLFGKTSIIGLYISLTILFILLCLQIFKTLRK